MDEFYFKSKGAMFTSDFVVSFLQEFEDQGENSFILSLQLKEITTPDRPTALRFLGAQTIIHMPCLSI
jgi:kinesin family protein C2/C3